MTNNKVFIPGFIYGTAWKEDETEQLTYLALKAGFRGIDTANQRRHYAEAGVGSAVTQFIDEGHITRQDVFIQTKYTFIDGQDHRLPYDPDAPVAAQVRQSYEKSLEHLGTDYLDSYVLHGPSTHFGLVAEDWDAWREMEMIFDEGGTRFLGVSNVDYGQLVELCEGSAVTPGFVQNRCYAVTGWDREIRAFCREMNIIYQGFSLLTANRQILASVEIADLARLYQKTPSQIIFRFARQAGMLPLTGTTSTEHMAQDLAAADFHIDAEHIEIIESLGEGRS